MAKPIVVLRPAVLELEVGERARVRVYVCADADEAVGADGQPGTRDDECERGVATRVGTSESLRVEPVGDAGFRWSVTGLEPGLHEVTTSADGANEGSMDVSVARPIPPDDPGAIGTRDRRRGDLDGDGVVTREDVALLTELVANAPRGVIAASDPTVPVGANILGGPFITSEDVDELEVLERRTRARARAVERARVDLTPGDIVPLEAGGIGILGIVVDASGRVDIPGTFPVNLAGRDRLYYAGPGAWGGAGAVPPTLVYEGPSFIVFTVPAPGFGFVGYQPPDADDTLTVAFEAVPPGTGLALPAPGGRLTVPLDVDRDHDLDWDDYIEVLAALGTRAGDRGFPARADVDGDGRITPIDLDAIVPALMFSGPADVGGQAGSGDLDGDGDLDARDVRAAVAYLGVERAAAGAIVESSPIADGFGLAGDLLLARVEEVVSPPALDLDADGDFDGDDVLAMASAADVELADLGPHYFGATDMARLPAGPGAEQLDVDGNGVLGPGDVLELVGALDRSLAAGPGPLDDLARYDLDEDGVLDFSDLEVLLEGIDEG